MHYLCESQSSGCVQCQEGTGFKYMHHRIDLQTIGPSDYWAPVPFAACRSQSDSPIVLAALHQ